MSLGMQWSRSALSSTMAAALPPSSRTTRFLPARAFMRQPTSAERKAARQAPAPGRGGAQIERDDLAVDALGLGGGDLEAVLGAVDLGEGVADRFAALVAHAQRQLLAARAHAGGDGAADRSALV